ncbi:hypothetical protein [Microbacterium sp. 18062]|uniref:hypothetical protein n=1 Tax=Microbacterium sp. 18062 TaxID=2681410 RepID=UPI0013569E86|nr:hypothetical protein [Microbacterium sp. 18062]
MSGSGEYADPGRNYPDNEGASEPDPAPTLADPNRSVSDAPPAPPGTTQDAPVMDQHSASVDDKIDGIVAQTRVDVADRPHERIVEVLRQRFDDAGISADDALLDELAKKVVGG